MPEVDEETKRRNMELCGRFPFLIPSNRFSGKRITEAADGGFWPGAPGDVPDYDYEYTELDDMPDGWRKAFGEQMCRELMDELSANGLVDTYRIYQIKEKFGMLCWYDNGLTQRGHEIVSKYCELSRRTCISCGKPAKWITTGWISPWCDGCVPEHEARFAIPVDEYMKDCESDPV